ncbi:MAG: chorismate synthase [Chloroflexi bacterium]|nr:chorismate synthase [Chloroflexota bacterium]MCI0578945.1 chorismate synthase [Chloroflexota bacterium]MCI0646882.1 chorismate synthase [Chloroflexota bacterium]MCI0730800.1 chorismate synthase [Chloroflexota bacterium]
MPAGLALDRDELNRQMARRQKGYGSGGRMKIEQDAVHITAGVMAGRTTGGPIGMRIPNLDYAKWQEREIPPLTVPRPGHADLTGAIKYGYGELRLSLERASARETAARVAVGAICKQLLAAFNITIGSYVVSIGEVTADIPAEMSYEQRFAAAEENDVRCPIPEAAEAMRARIREIMQARDTLGGVFEVVAVGVPPGLGSHVHWDRRLDALLLWSVGSIHAIKGVEIGPAFANAARPGSAVHDEIFLGEDGRLVRRSNNAGGFEGGVTTGEPVVVRAAMKPISTVLDPRRSVDLASGEETDTVYERSDFCAVPRAAVVGEAMVAITLAGALLEKLGGDSLDEMRPRFAALRQARLADLPMDNAPWKFGYDA